MNSEPNEIKREAIRSYRHYYGNHGKFSPAKMYLNAFRRGAMWIKTGFKHKKYNNYDNLI